MSVAITALYAAILALIVIALAVNVTVHRVKLRVPLGDGGNAQMRRMIRLHGNAAEYIPFAVLLVAIYELNAGSHTALHVIGIALIRGPCGSNLGHVGNRPDEHRTPDRPMPDLALGRSAGGVEFVEGGLAARPRESGDPVNFSPGFPLTRE